MENDQKQKMEKKSTNGKMQNIAKKCRKGKRQTEMENYEKDEKK